MIAAPSTVANEILVEIRKVLRRVSQQSRRVAQHSGLTLPQLLVLRAVASAPPNERTVMAIARTVNLSPPTVSGIVDRLGRAGLIVRTRDELDRRRVALQPTPAGQEKLLAVPTPLQDDFVRKIHALSEERRNALLESLRELVDLMDAGDIDAAPILADGDISSYPPDGG